MRRFASIVGSLIALFWVLVLVSPTSACATPVLVSVFGSDVAGNGTPESPYATVQHALDMAVEGDDIYVGPGQFNGRVFMKDGVSLFGSGAATTTLKGIVGWPVVTAISIGEDEIITDFTITGGGGLDEGWPRDAGGISCYRSSPTISDNVITGNLLAIGGGIACRYSSPIIKNNTITDNEAIFGGGIYCSDSSPTISGNTIAANSSNNAGGGIWCSLSSPIITGNTISDNSTVFSGGGIRLSQSPAAIAGNIIEGNTTLERGGGIYCESSSPNITNTTISGNTAVDGGGLYVAYSAPAMTYTTIYGNSASIGGGVSCGPFSAPAITNCIVWSNGTDLSHCTASYSDVQNADTALGQGSFSSDPRFVDVAAGNLRLALGSPCIDTATSTVAPVTDADGVFRPRAGRYDMGAYEYVSPTTRLNYAPGPGGSIAGESAQTIAYEAFGSSVTAMPDAYHHFIGWSDSATANPRIDSGAMPDVSVSAFFAIDTHTRTYTAGSGGSIEGSATQVLDHDTDGSAVNAKPATGHHFVKWSDDSTTNPRTDTSVTANKSVNAIFAIDTHTLTYTAGSGGSIEGSATQILDHNTDGGAVTATPAIGYQFVNWSDGSTANPRTDRGVITGKKVSAVFAVNTRSLTYTAGSGGSIEGSATQIVDYDADGTAVTATPAAGYHFVKWSDESTTNPRTDTSVKDDKSVNAIFAVDAPMVRTVTRVAGAARWDVAANLARKGWDPANTKTWAGVEHVIIANGENGKEADPLSAAGLAGVYDAPVLLTQTSGLPAATKAVIAEIARKNPRVKIHLIGGTASVPDARWNDIRRIKGVSTTKDRIAGANRYDVSANIANRIVSVAGVGSIQGVILIAADNPAAFYDALAASPIAYSNRMPMLSVKKGSVPSSVVKVLKSAALRGKPRYAASSAAYIGAGSLSGATRLTTSSNRYTTASQIANKAIGMSWATPKDTGLAAKLPDALTGGTYLGKRGGVMLFTPSSSTIQSVSKTFISANKSSITNGWVIGGSGSVPAAQETTFRNLLK